MLCSAVQCHMIWAVVSLLKFALSSVGRYPLFLIVYVWDEKVVSVSVHGLNR